MNISNNSNQISPSETVKEIFSLILEAADDENYEKCAANAYKFIDEYKKLEAVDEEVYKKCTARLPYACYFKLFSDAYRTWQISYDYTPIRNRFIIAYKTLHRGLQKQYGSKIPADDLMLLSGFEYLSKMLCAYTRCENSFINNDPFALEDYANEARQLESDAINLLESRKPETTADFRSKIANWLEEYLRKNYLLHDGLKDCADCYIKILKEKCFLPEVEKKLKQIKENNLKSLNELSPELSTELNAHIRHIEQHNERLKLTGENNTYLRINKGSLVNMLSAAFDTDLALKLFMPSVHKKFEEHIKNGFKKLGVETSSYQIRQLHDIFQTSFGENYLKVMSFDLYKGNNLQNSKEISAEILNELYDFDLRFSVSALGVCTVSFILNIYNLKDKPDSEDKNNLRYENGERIGGLRVEEARVLQSLLCPHAGQVKIENALSNNSKLKDCRLIEQLEFADLLKDMEDLRCLKDNCRSITDENVSSYNSVIKTVDLIDDSLEELEMEWLSKIKSVEDKNESEKIKKLQKSLKCLVEPDLSENAPAECRDMITEISRKSDTYQNVTHLAEQYLSVIREALEKTLEQEVKLPLAADTGWFTYLYCFSIDEVSRTDNTHIINEHAGFNAIANHPDMSGFIIEQREARASFDDWRFIKRYDSQNKKLVAVDLQERNLAHIRSHEADGFFCTQYQAFIYFPDDPMYLTDQYESTVRLMVRLATVLKYISEKARQLAENIQSELLIKNRENKSSNMDDALDDIRRLRLHAKELQTLVARAALSRYKDHGDLMKRTLSEMKLDQMANLLDQQLQHLSELYTDVLNEIEERREKRGSHAIEFLIVVVSFSALHDLAESLVGVIYKSEPENIDYLKSQFTFYLLVPALALYVLLIAYRKWGWNLPFWRKDDNNKKI